MTAEPKTDFVMVPREATPEMFKAAFHAVTTRTLMQATGGVMLDLLALEDQHKLKASLRWAAMIAAAPSLGGWRPIAEAPVEEGMYLISGRHQSGEPWWNVRYFDGDVTLYVPGGRYGMRSQA